MSEPGCRLFVYGLSDTKRKYELLSLFCKYGRVIDVYNSKKGYGFVTFENKDDAALAMKKLNGYRICGRKITINIAKPRNSGGQFDWNSNGGDCGGLRGDESFEKGESERNMGSVGLCCSGEVVSHIDGISCVDNLRSGGDSYENKSIVGNMSVSNDDSNDGELSELLSINDITGKDETAWLYSSLNDNVSNVENEDADLDIKIKVMERIPKGRVEGVKVISCNSPVCLIGRRVVWEDDYRSMIEDLSGHCEGTLPKARIKVGMGVGIKLENLDWIRARIVKTSEDEVEVYLCDFGYNVTSTWERVSICMLKPCHALLPQLALAFHVSGLVGAGGGGWSRSAMIFTEKFLQKGDVEVKILDSPIIDTNLPFLPCYPSNVYVTEQVIDGPMSPAIATKMDLSESLHYEGLAFTSKELEKPIYVENIIDNGCRGGDNVIGELCENEVYVDNDFEYENGIQRMKNIKVENKDSDVERSFDDVNVVGSVIGNGNDKEEEGARSVGDGYIKDLGVSNDDVISCKEDCVEKIGLRGELNGKKGLSVVDEGRDYIDIENFETNDRSRSKDGGSVVLSSSWTSDNDRFGSKSREVGEKQVYFVSGSQVGNIGESFDWCLGKDIPKNGWIPSKKPCSLEFFCECTFVDYRGILSVSTKEQVLNRNFINLILHKAYYGSKFTSEENAWNVGDACVAMSYLDMKWYRGTVMSTDKETAQVRVLFVDYGNRSWCNEKDVRGILSFSKDIPIQSFTIKLGGEMAGKCGEWTKEKLDILSKLLTEGELYVKLSNVNTSVPLVEKVEFHENILQKIIDGNI